MTPLDLALSYIASGVPIFPCRDADEETGEFDAETGEFKILQAKSPLTPNGFKDATKHEHVTTRRWGNHPTAMIGIPTGESINAFVLDVDVKTTKDGAGVNGYHTLDGLVAKYGPLPETATVATAGGGRHYYFNHVPGLRNRGELGTGLDVRGSGGYVIGAGSKMADGRSYDWLDYDGPGIPPVADAPQWLIDLIMPKQVETPPYNPATIRGHGDNPSYVARAVESELSILASTGHGARNNQLNDSAFALGQFVGAGALSELDARGQLEEIAKQWPNFPLSKGTINRGLKAGILSPRDIPAPDHLSEQDPVVHVVDVKNMIYNTIRRQNEAIHGTASIDQDDIGSDITTGIAEGEQEDDVPEYKLEAISDLESATTPGGLVEELIDWIVSSAEQPNRTLALAAVLPLVASLAGSRYSTGSRDTRPNIYTVALAESGFGKEHARSQIKRLLMESQGVLDKFGGPARIMSASALREILEMNSSVNCQIDEFGGFVRDITDRNAGGHQRAISTDLRDYYSASSTYFEGAAYRGSPPKRIYNPNLCIHGTSTPDQFWSALSSASAEDGLLPRLILFLVDGQKPEPVKPERDVRKVPHSLLMRMTTVAGIDIVQERTVFGKGSLGKVLKSQEKGQNKPYEVPWTDDAHILFASLRQAIDAEEGKVPSESRPFVRRILENTVKLALIVAIGINPEEPEITEANLEWGAELAWTCAATMLSQVSERLSDNQREANYKRIAGIIRGAGKAGITLGRLVDRLKSIDARQRDEIVKDLKESGKVVVDSKQTKGRATSRLTWAA